MPRQKRTTDTAATETAAAAASPARKAAPTASVRAIAGRLGLSPATVSLALNGQRPNSFVSVATRRAVWQTAEEMGYPLDRLRSRRPAIERVAIFANTGRDSVYGETLVSLCRCLNQRQIHALTHSPLSDREGRETARELSRRQEIDAAVFVGSRHETEPIRREDFGGLPCVFIGETPPGSDVWQVRPDNDGGGRLAAEHLWSLGHRTVALLLPASDLLVSERRLAGLRAYWAEQEHCLRDEDVFWTPSDNSVLLRETVARLAQNNARRTDGPVTALFCFNDWIGGMALKTLHTLGVRVPEELSVVGFDNNVYTILLDPPLTSVDQPFGAFGEMAADLLLMQAESPNAEPIVRVAPCTLVVRESTGAAPHKKS